MKIRKMFFFIYYMVILLVIQRTNCTLCVTKVIVRVPKEKDIGLIFDLTVTNKGEKKDIQEFVVTSDGTCTLNTTNGDQVRNVGRIFGGDFGAIQPGKTETISLSLYNRVGTCPIIISTTNSQNELSHTLQLLHFDTRFETLDPEKHSLRKHRDFTDCNNWDKDYFHNCTPLNCEERYFGQRSFYNFKTEQCEQVTPCSSQDEYYDMYANECVDKNNFITEEELEQIRDGKFDNNYLELRGGSSNGNKETPTASTKKGCSSKPKQCSSGRLSLQDFNNCLQHLEMGKTEEEINQGKAIRESQPNMSGKKSTLGLSLTSFYYDWYLPWRSENIEEEEQDREGTILAGSHEVSSGARKLDILGWIGLISKGLFIILLLIIFQMALTCVTYIFICITIYGFLELVSKLKKPETFDGLSRKLTPRDTESQHSIVTSTSCMSQR
ncbi:uncharacterized protein LOC6650762 isoform X2 [Drosophila willistoni]|uniref:uncharacterized protein LOC6650762 isoform X2 n=1 Tax=Drosophila willistoni TaxID=7260 RepID=UPI001F07DBD7|nr:uncharacterized protein LOC6650762 isoform X2 [Drosophila willistoni]